MFKKVRRSCLSLFMVLAMILSGSSVLSASAASRFEGVTTSQVNVRTKPSSKSTRIGKLEKGKKVIIVASVKKGRTKDGVKADTDFLKLETGGYVAAKYIRLTKELSSSSSSSSSSSKDTSSSEATGSDASTDETENNEAPTDDEEVLVGDEDATAAEEDGVEITDDGTGEDNSSESTETASNATSTALPPNATAEKMQASGSVNVRAKPSTDGEVLKTLSAGEVVTTVGTYTDDDDFEGSTVKGTWYQLYAGGFVSGDFLGEAKGTTTTSKTVKDTKTVKTTVVTATSDTTMYASPNGLATKKGTLKKGKSMNVSSTLKSGSTYKAMTVSGTWYKLSNGAFVKSGTVKLDTKSETKSVDKKVTETTGSAVTLSVGDGVKARKSVNIRQGPSTSSKKQGLLSSGSTGIVSKVVKSGSTVDGKKVSGTWYELAEGGYVHGDYVIFDAELTLSNYQGGVAGGSEVVDSDIPMEEEPS